MEWWVLAELVEWVQNMWGIERKQEVRTLHCTHEDYKSILRIQVLQQQNFTTTLSSESMPQKQMRTDTFLLRQSKQYTVLLARPVKFLYYKVQNES